LFLGEAVPQPIVLDTFPSHFDFLSFVFACIAFSARSMREDFWKLQEIKRTLGARIAK
jgi:hypothetical protein